MESLLTTALLISTFFYLFHRYFTRNFDYWQRKGVQFKKPTIFFGNFLDLLLVKKHIGDYLAEMYFEMKDYDYFGIWIFNKPHLVIRNPELSHNILVKNFGNFSTRGMANDEKADPIFSKMLFSSNVNYWRPLRARLTPIFTSGKMRNMLPLIDEAAKDMKEYLLQHPTVDAKEMCAKFTTDVITSYAFGVNAQSFKYEHAEFREVGRKMFDYNIRTAVRGLTYFFLPHLVKLFRISFFPSDVNAFCRKAFWDTLYLREESGQKRNDVIDIMIEMRKQGSKDGIEFEGDTVVAQGLQFFAAGFETTSSTIAFALYELALKQEIQDKVRAEINDTLQRDNGLTYDNVFSMPYLDKVVKEVLRKYPTLPFLNRRCVEDYKVPNTDLIIEKGTMVNIPLFGLHYDPKYFPDPQLFDPERFSDDNFANIVTGAYIPFGEGPHNCIGARYGVIVSKLGIVNILQNFKVLRNEKTPVPLNFDPRSFVLMVNNGIPLDFQPVRAEN